MSNVREYLEAAIKESKETATRGELLADALAEIERLRGVLRDTTMRFELESLRYLRHRDMLVREVESLRADLKEAGGVDHV